MKLIKLLSIGLLFPVLLLAQTTHLSLDDALYLAHNESYVKEFIRYDSLLHTFENKSFKTQVLPKIFMTSNSDISHGITTVTLPDGSDRFVNRYVSNYGLNLSVSQLIPLTGGSFYISSAIRGLYNFAPEKLHSFSLNMFNFSYSQQLNNYNEYKWNKKLIEKQNVLYDTKYYQELESLNQKIVDAYLELYIQQAYIQLNEKLSILSKDYLDRNRLLFQEGKILEEDLLDSEIQYRQLLNNAQNKTLYKKLENNFIYLLNLPENLTLDLNYSYEIFTNIFFSFDKKQILNRCLKYNQTIQFEYDELNFQKNLQKNKASSGIVWNLSLGGGMNSYSNNFPDLLINPQRQFNITLSASIPLLDWGNQKLTREKMDIQHKIQQLSNKEKEKNFVNDIEQELDYILVLHQDILNEKKMMEIQNRKLELLEKKMKLEQVNVLDFSKAQTDIIKTTISYNRKIKDLIMLIYKYRYMSLWDIMNNTPLYIDQDF